MNNYMEIMNKKLELLDKIETLDLFMKLEQLNQDVMNNEEISKLLVQFNKIRDEYQEVSKYGKYHPDFSDVSKKLIEAKTNLYNNPIVKEYKETEIELSDLINEISFHLDSLISPTKCEKTSR